MKRDFLKNLNLEADIIEKIMAEHGKTVNSLNERISSLEQDITAKDTEISGLNDQLKQRDSDLEDLKGKVTDNESLKTQLGELQTKYTTDTKALEQKLTDQKNEFETAAATDKFFEGVEFSSQLAKDAAISQFKAKAFKLADGVFQGAKEWLDNLRKDSPDAFKPEPTGDDNGANAGGQPYFTGGMQNSNAANPQPGTGGNPANAWGFQQVRGFEKK